MDNAASNNYNAAEQHGAIRLGTKEELRLVKRLLRVFGLEAVHYYDLSIAGIPLHSTAFRSIDNGPQRNSFRLFVSLLRTELIEDQSIRSLADDLLRKRSIASDRLLHSLDEIESQNGVKADQVDLLIHETLLLFQWDQKSAVNHKIYQRIKAMHPIVADIICFQKPHINHLTPRTKDIDAIQRCMIANQMHPKEIIEGPPKRKVDILLRQTSFKAIKEDVLFTDGTWGTHQARFGEVEQRGAALTPKGYRCYQALLDQAMSYAKKNPKEPYENILKDIFREFPDDLDTLHKLNYIYVTYQCHASAEDRSNHSFETLCQLGLVTFKPQIYEDFLPISAAGIFRSNLKENAPYKRMAGASQSSFEASLGDKIFDPFKWYQSIEDHSKILIKSSLV